MKLFMTWRQRKLRHVAIPAPVQELCQLCGVDYYQINKSSHDTLEHGTKAKKTCNNNDIKELVCHHLHNGLLAIGTLGLVSNLGDNCGNIETSDDINNPLKDESLELKQEVVVDNHMEEVFLITTNTLANREISTAVLHQSSKEQIASAFITPSNAASSESAEIKSDYDQEVKENGALNPLLESLCLNCTEAPPQVIAKGGSRLNDDGGVLIMSKSRKESVGLDENDKVQRAGIYKVFPPNVKRILLSNYLAKYVFKSFSRAPQQLDRNSNYQSKLQKFFRMFRKQKSSSGYKANFIPGELAPPLIHDVDPSDDNSSLDDDDTSIQCAKGDKYQISTDDEFVVLEL